MEKPSQINDDIMCSEPSELANNAEENANRQPGSQGSPDAAAGSNLEVPKAKKPKAKVKRKAKKKEEDGEEHFASDIDGEGVEDGGELLESPEKPLLAENSEKLSQDDAEVDGEVDGDAAAEAKPKRFAKSMKKKKVAKKQDANNMLDDFGEEVPPAEPDFQGFGSVNSQVNA